MHAQMDSTKHKKQVNCEGHYSVCSYVCCRSLGQTVQIDSNNLDYKIKSHLISLLRRYVCNYH